MLKVYKTEEDVKITESTSEKYTLFPKVGIATFGENTTLYRGTKAIELYEVIVNNKKMRGGFFSVKVEQKMGASFAGEKEDAIKAAKAERINYSGKDNDYKGGEFVITINANNKQFLHINLSEKIPNKVGQYSLPENFGNLGLGFSVRNITKNDIIKVEQLKDGNLIDVTKNIKSLLQDFYDEKNTNKNLKVLYGGTPLKDEVVAKLSPKGIEEYVNLLLKHDGSFEYLNDFTIRKIGRANLDKLINQYLDIHFKNFLINPNFVKKYFNKEQTIQYLSDILSNGYGLPKPLEKFYYDVYVNLDD